MRDPHTLALAQAAATANTLTQVAMEIGYSRTAMSRYMSDKYGAETGQLESAIRARYDRYPCTHTGREIHGPECHRRATSPRPFGGRAKEAHWLTCQSCQYFHPQGEKS
jgi:hypothetical protein